jgi:hypothetical protein
MRMSYFIDIPQEEHIVIDSETARCSTAVAPTASTFPFTAASQRHSISRLHIHAEVGAEAEAEDQAVDQGQAEGEAEAAVKHITSSCEGNGNEYAAEAAVDRSRGRDWSSISTSASTSVSASKSMDNIHDVEKHKRKSYQIVKSQDDIYCHTNHHHNDIDNDNENGNDNEEHGIIYHVDHDQRHDDQKHATDTEASHDEEQEADAEGDNHDAENEDDVEVEVDDGDHGDACTSSSGATVDVKTNADELMAYLFDNFNRITYESTDDTLYKNNRSHDHAHSHSTATRMSTLSNQSRISNSNSYSPSHSSSHTHNDNCSYKSNHSVSVSEHEHSRMTSSRMSMTSNVSMYTYGNSRNVSDISENRGRGRESTVNGMDVEIDTEKLDEQRTHDKLHIDTDLMKEKLGDERIASMHMHEHEHERLNSATASTASATPSDYSPFTSSSSTPSQTRSPSTSPCTSTTASPKSLALSSIEAALASAGIPFQRRHHYQHQRQLQHEHQVAFIEDDRKYSNFVGYNDRHFRPLDDVNYFHVPPAAPVIDGISSGLTTIGCFIAMYNEPGDDLRRTLQSLYRQKYDCISMGYDLHAIVVIDGWEVAS